MPKGGTRPAGEVLEKPRSKTKEPTLYRVLLHNDDYTTMDFVVEILETIFERSPAEAHRIMMEVHKGGPAVCGVYPYDVAETKAALVHDRAKVEGFPLRCSVEEE